MKSLSLTLYTAEQIRQLERIAVNEYKISAEELMRRAGAAAFATFKRQWPEAKSVSIFCGGGNNGGDGYVFANLAAKAGCEVSVYTLSDSDNLPETAFAAYQACLNTSIKITTFKAIPPEIKTGDVIIDALLGVGLTGEVRDLYRAAILFINHCKKPVLAMDIPSGLHSDTGIVEGCAVKATLTQTFIGLKSGLVTAAAKEYCGEMSVDDLGIPATAFQSIISQRSLIPFKQLQQKWLLPRARDAHKGDFGHVLIIGGDLGMAGAVTMTGISALRAGAGLVTIATRHDHIAAVIANCPELMVKGVEDEKQIRPLIEKATVIAIGPGLGQSSWSEKLFNTVMACSQQLVVDADALNLLAKNKRHSSRWILTPHPGEAARLLNTTTQAIQQDRYAAIAALQKQYGGVCVLKGSGTLIADDKNSYVCTAGNPGMAAGGMGDVLTGIIAGLQAQQISPFDAACLAVECHAHAADDAAAEQGERGIMALDLLMHLQTWVNPL